MGATACRRRAATEGEGARIVMMARSPAAPPSRRIRMLSSRCPSSRLAALFAALVLIAPASAPATARTAAPRGATPRDDAKQAALEQLRERHKLPALGAAVFSAEKLEGEWVTGRRAIDAETPAEVGDAWHLGSCTKSMTATLIALLVERGDLKWETPLRDCFPDLKKTMNAAYADLTVVELLAHRAGVPAMTEPDGAFARCAALPGSPTDQRRAFVGELLAKAPTSKPRAQGVYSNAGFIVAGHIAERATGKSWEELIEKLLFKPLGMKSAGFGPPGDADEMAALRGHIANGATLTSIEPGPGADNPPFLGPAGTVHATLADWVKYLQLHLRGVKGDVKVGAITLHQTTFARLHSAYPIEPGDEMVYGYGWGLPKRDWAAGDRTVATHTGSNNLWFCCCWLDLAGGWGMIATTNAGGAAASAATDAAVGIAGKERLQAGSARKAEPAGGTTGGK
jgi:CubicO group peptidase (beta-lactamase class C family)